MNQNCCQGEKELLRRVASGDRLAFSQLYLEYIDNVYHYIYLFTRSEEETTELLQEVFVGLWEKKEKLSAIDCFKSYLFRAAKNKLLNQVRHARVRDRVLTEISRTAGPSHESVYYRITYKEYNRLVYEAVERLPPKRQQIFRMNVEQGLSYDEIADYMSISKSVVKNQFYTACASVRQYLYRRGELFIFLLLWCFAVLPK